MVATGAGMARTLVRRADWFEGVYESLHGLYHCAHQDWLQWEKYSWLQKL